MSDATDNRFYREKQEQPSSKELLARLGNISNYEPDDAQRAIDDAMAELVRYENGRVVMSAEIDRLRMAERLNVETVARLQQERDRLAGQLDAAEQHVKILREERYSQPPEEIHRDGEFLRGWLQIDRLPGGMMVSNGEPFGPVPAMSSCLVTTSEATAKEWADRGKPTLEFMLAVTKAATPRLHSQAECSEIAEISRQAGKEECRTCKGTGVLKTGTVHGGIAETVACDDCTTDEKAESPRLEDIVDSENWCPQCAHPRGACVCAHETNERRDE